ncbi:hypothetical protein PG990_014748 [Apiospora arundinis]|uniref:RNA-binding protein n=1 Tax=Apiospora arundinis TaxID=335852 RepID=A0ABR2HL94_9PEZI
MPKYWVKDADRSGLPVLTEEQRKQIRTCFVEDLGHKFYVESLYYYLREALIDIASKDAGFEETAKYKTEWCTLKVSNLAVYVHEEDLYELFGKYGEVTFVYLFEEHVTDLPRGDGLVTMAKREEAVEARQRLAGSTFLHERIGVSFDRHPYIEEEPRIPLQDVGAGWFGSHEPPVRAKIELEDMSENESTYATIVITTSWPLTEQRKAALEQKKTMLLGDTLGPRVFLAYDECEPPA